MTTREAHSSSPPPAAATTSSPLSSRNISPRTSPGLRPKASTNTNTTTRQPSVHFPPNEASPPLSRSPPSPHRANKNSDHNNDDNNNATQHSTAIGAESSGDEITPIMQRERGSGKGRNYDGTAIATTSIPSSNGGGRRRRQDGSKWAIKSTQRRGDDDDHDDDHDDELQENRRGAEEDDDNDTEEGGSRVDRVVRWIKSVAEKYGSVELDNKGSVARDHLALERTFLAWLRTSLAFASIGIAITQLFRLNTTISERQGLTPDNPPPASNNTWHLKQVGKPLGATFLGIAILVLLLGGRRYFESQYWIIRGKFPASRGSVLLVTAVAVGLIVTSLVVVCVVDPSVFEKR